MQFDEILTRVVDLLQRQGRVSYRALKLRFELDEEFLAGIKDELVDAQRVARDEEGKVLVWVGEQEKGETAKGEKELDCGPRTLDVGLPPVWPNGFAPSRRR